MGKLHQELSLAHVEGSGIQFCNKAPCCTFTFIFNFVDGLIENILGDMLHICNDIKVGLVNRVFLINKGKRKNIGTSI